MRTKVDGQAEEYGIFQRNQATIIVQKVACRQKIYDLPAQRSVRTITAVDTAEKCVICITYITFSVSCDTGKKSIKSMYSHSNSIW